MVTKVILRVVIFVSILLPFFAESIHAADYLTPFNQMKEVVLAQGEKSDDGTFVLQRQLNGIEYWMIYFPSDGSIAFGKATSSGSYSWGILYDLEGKFLLLETFMGQLVNLTFVEAEGAIEVASQFVGELEALIGGPSGGPTRANLINV